MTNRELLTTILVGQILGTIVGAFTAAGITIWLFWGDRPNWPGPTVKPRRAQIPQDRKVT